jgi:hypothetical protein
MTTRLTRTHLQALRRAAETQLQAPGIVSRRLAGLSGLSPYAAALQWNRWALEKSAVGSLVGLRAMRAGADMWLSWLGTAQSGPTPAKLLRVLERGAAASTSVLDPLHRRVRRNAKSKRRI